MQADKKLEEQIKKLIVEIDKIGIKVYTNEQQISVNNCKTIKRFN